jgi:signal transduction histidine kinase
VSIRTKFVLSITTVILIFGGISLIVTYNYVVKLSKEELKRKASLTALVLRDQLDQLIIMNDFVSINNLIYNIKHDDPEILYIIVFNKKKEIVGHTFENGQIPQYLLKSVSQPGMRFFGDNKSGLTILEVTENFMRGEMGSVSVGLDESVLNDNGGRIVSLLIAVFSLLIIFVAIATAFLSYFILHPINQVIGALGSFVPGQKLPEFKIVFNDEIKLLGLKFREMTDRLNAMVNEFKKTQLHMIETEKLASIGTLASGVAHEINNPIAGIEFCAHRLQKHTVSDAKHDEYVKLITESARHIQTIVRSLLAYARQPDQKNELVDLCLVAKFSLKLLHYRLQKKEITVTEQLPVHPCFVYGIRAHLVQVVVNGIINAIDASNSGGTIAVDIYENGTNFGIDITDNGAGLDASVAGKAFDPFFTTKGNQGTGLGLYVSYNIVLAHNGVISLSPQNQGGAKLQILLPKAGEDKMKMETLNSGAERIESIS